MPRPGDTYPRASAEHASLAVTTVAEARSLLSARGDGAAFAVDAAAAVADTTGYSGQLDAGLARARVGAPAEHRPRRLPPARHVGALASAWVVVAEPGERLVDGLVERHPTTGLRGCRRSQLAKPRARRCDLAFRDRAC